MEQQTSTLDDLVADFTTLADRLGMPDSERAGIMGVNLETWPVWSPFTQMPERRAEYRRRLEYALPLMRRSLSGG
jgi:hypothetical protein